MLEGNRNDDPEVRIGYMRLVLVKRFTKAPYYDEII